MQIRLRFEIGVFGAMFLVALACLGYLVTSGRLDTSAAASSDTAKPAQDQRDSSRPGGAARQTPLPDEAVTRVTPLPATPVPALPTNLATPRPTVDADMEPGTLLFSSLRPTTATASQDGLSPDEIFSKAMAIYAGRQATGASGLVDLPVTTMGAFLTAPSSASSLPPAHVPLIATAKATIKSDDSEALRNSPQGFVIGKQGIRSVEKTDITPDLGSVEFADYTGGQSELTTTRVDSLLRKYNVDDLPPPAASPPPIAVPKEFRTSEPVATPAPTKSVLQRAHNIPTQMLQTRMPIMSNVNGDTTDSSPQTDAPPGRGNLPFPSDAGTIPFGARLPDSQSVQLPRASGAINAPNSPQVTAHSPPSSTVLPAQSPPPAGLAVSTPAQLSAPGESNPAGYSPSVDPTVLGIPRAPGVIVPDPQENGRIPGDGNVSPSPRTAMAAVETPKYNAVPAPARGPIPDESMPVQASPSSLLDTLGHGKHSVVASVGERKLTQQDLSRRAEAAVRMKSVRLGEAERQALEDTIADDWAEKTAVAEEARRQGLGVSDDEVRQYLAKTAQRTGGDVEKAMKSAGFTENEILAEMRDSALCEKFIETAFEKGFDEAKIRAVYDAAPQTFQPARRFHVQQMELVQTEGGQKTGGLDKQARELHQRAKRGEDFLGLAKEASSISPDGRNGDIGWLDDESEFTEDMANALLALKPGQVSEPIKTPRGFQILRLVEIEEPKPGFEGARDKVILGIQTYLRRASYDTAKRNFNVTVNGRKQKPKEEELTESGSSGSGKVRVRNRLGEEKSVERSQSATGRNQPVPSSSNRATRDFGSPVSTRAPKAPPGFSTR